MEILPPSWMIELCVVVPLLICAMIFLKKLFERFSAWAIKRGDLKVEIDAAAIAPLRALLWILLVSFIVHLGARQIGLEGIAGGIVALRNAGIVGCVAWFLLRWKSILQQAFMRRRMKEGAPMEAASIEILGKIFTIVVVFLSALIVLQIFGLNIAPLIAFGGIGAAALGIASREVIANFFGGFMIYITRPFAVNDLIELSQKKVIGYVESIGWYYTAIRDLEKKPLYVPNSVFPTEVVTNHSRMTHRRISETVGIRSSDLPKAAGIAAQIEKMLSSHADIDARQSVSASLHAFAPSSVELEIKAYTLSTRYEDFMKVRQRVLLDVADLIRSAGAEMPLPTSEVVLRKID